MESLLLRNIATNGRAIVLGLLALDIALYLKTDAILPAAAALTLIAALAAAWVADTLTLIARGIERKNLPARGARLFAFGFAWLCALLTMSAGCVTAVFVLGAAR